jgi:hypothetical protein
VDQESIYSDYKDVEGIKTAARIDFKGGGFNRTLEDIEITVLEKVDPSSFSLQ